jgi:uncharacterized membrane protein
LYLLLAYAPGSGRPNATSATALDLPAQVTFADARHVLDRRCGACHSTQPSDSTITAAPAGVTFDLPEQIQMHATRIRERAVATRTMPPANKTQITDRERAILDRWIEQGARIP